MVSSPMDRVVQRKELKRCSEEKDNSKVKSKLVDCRVPVGKRNEYIDATELV